MAMTEVKSGKRAQLLRESLLFQVKLLADGLRDFLLMPVSLLATGVGLLRSGDDPEAEFVRVLELGRKSEQWINLFGTHEPLHEAGDAGSIDRLVSRAEQVVRDQVNTGAVSASAGRAIGDALGKLHDKARGVEGAGKKLPGGQ
jgi:hypothetical protein